MFGAFFYSYSPVFIITSRLLFLKAHFLVKPNASLLGKICIPTGQRITTWPCLGIPKKKYSWASHFQLEEKLISGLDIWPRLDGPQPAQLIAAAMFSLLFRGEKLISGINIAQEKLCSAHTSKTQILLELLGPSCRPHLVQFSCLYWLHRLTMVWDRDVRKPGESKKKYSCT